VQHQTVFLSDQASVVRQLKGFAGRGSGVGTGAKTCAGPTTLAGDGAGAGAGACACEGAGAAGSTSFGTTGGSVACGKAGETVAAAVVSSRRVVVVAGRGAAVVLCRLVACLLTVVARSCPSAGSGAVVVVETAWGSVPAAGKDSMHPRLSCLQHHFFFSADHSTCQNASPVWQLNFGANATSRSTLLCPGHGCFSMFPARAGSRLRPVSRLLVEFSAWGRGAPGFTKAQR